MADEITTFEVDFIELELLNIEFIEKELVEINLNTIDVLPSLSGNGIIDLIFNETPTNVNSLPSKRFRTVNAFTSGKLEVYLNGMKIHSSEITIHSDTEFSFPLDIIALDMVEVSYIKQ